MSTVAAVTAAKVETGILAGTRTLLYKEVLRFWKVSFQTVAAPVLTAVLYLLIFGHVLEGRVTVFGSVGYTSFLIPGLVMMSVLQNAFANSSSSLIQSKITGNLVFLLVTPLSHWAWFLAYVGASVVRGVAVGAGVLLVTVWFAPLHVANPLWIVFFTVAGAALMGALGLIAGPLGGEVRPDRRVPELHHHADDVPVGRVLFGAVAAAVLARGQPPEPVLLHDRRLPPRLLRHQRRLAVAQPGDRRRQPGRGLRRSACTCCGSATRSATSVAIGFAGGDRAGKTACGRPAAAPTAAVAASGDSPAVLGLRACRIISLRSLRSLRSNRCGKSEVEARCARWLEALRSSAPQSRSAGLPHAALPAAGSGANALKRSASGLGVERTLRST